MRLSLSREGRLLLHGYYNSGQPLIQAVDKEKGITEKQGEIENLQQKVDKC